jgi:hypothetical protein
VLRVQIINSTGVTPPQLYDFTVKVTNAADIRNVPPTSRVSALVSNGLCQTKRDKLNLDCAFCKTTIVIDSIIASPSSVGSVDPSMEGKVSVGDKILVDFNQKTSRGRPILFQGSQVDGHICQNDDDCRDLLEHFLDTNGDGLVNH